MTSIHYINLNQSGGSANKSAAQKLIDKLPSQRRGKGQQVRLLVQEYNKLNDKFNELRRTTIANAVKQERAAQAAEQAAEQAASKKNLKKRELLYLATANKGIVQEKIKQGSVLVPADNCDGKMIYHVTIPNLITTKPSTTIQSFQRMNRAKQELNKLKEEKRNWTEIQIEDLPEGWKAKRDGSQVYYYNEARNKSQWNIPVDGLPDGWVASLDKESNKIYYIGPNGEAQWNKPTQ